MITATADDLVTYVAEITETVERHGATIVLRTHEPYSSLRQLGRDIVMGLHLRLPAAPGSREVDLALRELWTPAGRGRFELTNYEYELHDRQVGYRRACHRHDVDHFLRAFDVATHEHCEVPLGHAVCEHYHGPPVDGAIDGFLRLYGVWLAGVAPDCAELRCLR